MFICYRRQFLSMTDYNCSHEGMQPWGTFQKQNTVTTHILFILDRKHLPKHSWSSHTRVNFYLLPCRYCFPKFRNSDKILLYSYLQKWLGKSHWKNYGKNKTHFILNPFVSLVSTMSFTRPVLLSSEWFYQKSILPKHAQHYFPLRT